MYGSAIGDDLIRTLDETLGARAVSASTQPLLGVVFLAIGVFFAYLSRQQRSGH